VPLRCANALRLQERARSLVPVDRRYPYPKGKIYGPKVSTVSSERMMRPFSRFSDALALHPFGVLLTGCNHTVAPLSKYRGIGVSLLPRMNLNISRAVLAMDAKLVFIPVNYR
jgi:hypothetical protein